MPKPVKPVPMYVPLKCPKCSYWVEIQANPDKPELDYEARLCYVTHMVEHLLMDK